MKKFYKIIGVDFDGTLSIGGIYPGIGKPNKELIEYVLEQQKQGAYLILITMREGKPLDKAVEWCKKQGIEFDAVNDNLDFMKMFFKNNPRKIYCSEYIDDTNLGGIDYILQEIKRKRNKNVK